MVVVVVALVVVVAAGERRSGVAAGERGRGLRRETVILGPCQKLLRRTRRKTVWPSTDLVTERADKVSERSMKSMLPMAMTHASESNRAAPLSRKVYSRT